MTPDFVYVAISSPLLSGCAGTRKRGFPSGSSAGSRDGTDFRLFGVVGSTVLEHMFVLGIDPGLSATGYGVVEGTNPPKPHGAGVIRTDVAEPIAKRLRALASGLEDIFRQFQPDAVALETVFTNKNLQTAISVGRASGVALLVAAQHDVPVFEYVPTAIKAAVTGAGNADKKQVAKMVGRLLSLQEAPRPADAADALAIALCHLRTVPIRAVR